MDRQSNNLRVLSAVMLSGICHLPKHSPPKPHPHDCALNGGWCSYSFPEHCIRTPGTGGVVSRDVGSHALFSKGVKTAKMGDSLLDPRSYAGNSCNCNLPRSACCTRLGGH